MKEKRPVKSVQWRDEAGRGDLDDGGNNPVVAPPPPILSIIPASPGESVGSTSINAHSPVIRPGSALGSESEWEDDEKTDDSVNIAKLPSLTPSLSASTSSNFILVVVDWFSKQAIFILIDVTYTSTDLAQLFIVNMFSKHSIPSYVTCDHGSEFIFHFFTC